MELIKEKRPKTDFGADQLGLFFINHLNRIYCAKEHLVNRLPEIVEEADFLDLKFAIQETLTDVEEQIKRMDKIYLLMNTVKSLDNCSGLIGLIDDSFDMIFNERQSTAVRDLSIMFYMQNIESLEMASFKVLEIIARKFKNKQIKQLLKENFDEASADRALLLLIFAKYLKH